jgi:hypothetical protein
MTIAVSTSIKEGASDGGAINVCHFVPLCNAVTLLCP